MPRAFDQLGLSLDLLLSPYVRERGSVLYLGMATEILNLP